VACCDDERLSALLPRVSRRVFTYGTSSRADYVLRFLPPAPAAEDDTMLVRSRFEVVADGLVMGPFELHVPGRHNVLNATAAVAIAHQLDVAPEKIIAGLDAFRGVDRRFQVKGCVHGITVVDDYGHHPTEIRATLRAARDCHYARVHVIFQPHRYTRTRDLLSEFATAFVDADSVQVLDIYAASEEPIPGVDAQSLVAAAAQPGIEYAPGFTEAIARVLELARSGDVILTLGAGSVAQAAPLVLEQLRATSVQ
jgi:UDP-N-acetylmuramate--alanine ligase